MLKNRLRFSCILIRLLVKQVKVKVKGEVHESHWSETFASICRYETIKTDLGTWHKQDYTKRLYNHILLKRHAWLT